MPCSRLSARRAPRSFIAVLAVIGCLLAMASASAQSLSGPESIDFDAAHDRHLISNRSAGQILARAPGGSLSLFTDDPGSPAGIEIVGDLVFVADGSRIRGYRLSDAVRVVDYQISGATFLNGLSSNGSDRLWVTDFSNGRLHEVDISDPGSVSHSTPLPAIGFTPNGLWFDPVLDRLLIVSWGSSARIFSWRSGENSASLLATSATSNFDGVVVDCDGVTYVSSWGSQAILSVQPPLGPGSTFETFASPLSNPADLGYAESLGEIASANAGNSTVSFHLTPCAGVIFRDRFEQR